MPMAAGTGRWCREPQVLPLLDGRRMAAALLSTGTGMYRHFEGRTTEKMGVIRKPRFSNGDVENAMDGIFNRYLKPSSTGA